MRELIVYTAPNCAPCRQIKPALLQLQGTYGIKMRFVELSLETRMFFMTAGVRSAPTIACVEGEKAIGVFIGIGTYEELKAQFDAWGVLGVPS